MFESLEIQIEKEADNYFVLSIGKSSNDYFPKIHIDNFFTEYLNYFFNENNDIESNTIKKDLIGILKMKISNNELFLSDENILKFIKSCEDLNISLQN